MARRRPAEPTVNPARGAALVVVAVVIGLFLLREGLDTSEAVTANSSDEGSDSSDSSDSSDGTDEGDDGTTSTTLATRPPGEVPTIVLNDSGMAGAAGTYSDVLAGGRLPAHQPRWRQRRCRGRRGHHDRLLRARLRGGGGGGGGRHRRTRPRPHRAAHHAARPDRRRERGRGRSAPTSPASRPPRTAEPREAGDDTTTDHRRADARAAPASEPASRGGPSRAQLVGHDRLDRAAPARRRAEPRARRPCPSLRVRLWRTAPSARSKAVVADVRRSPSSTTSLPPVSSVAVSTSTERPSRRRRRRSPSTHTQAVEATVAGDGALLDRPIGRRRASGRSGGSVAAAARSASVVGSPIASAGRPSSCWIACSEPARSTDHGRGARRGRGRRGEGDLEERAVVGLLDHRLARLARSRAGRSCAGASPSTVRG